MAVNPLRSEKLTHIFTQKKCQIVTYVTDSFSQAAENPRHKGVEINCAPSNRRRISVSCISVPVSGDTGFQLQGRRVKA
jgi:hypothetical protein